MRHTREGENARVWGPGTRTPSPVGYSIDDCHPSQSVEGNGEVVGGKVIPGRKGPQGCATQGGDDQEEMLVTICAPG